MIEILSALGLTFIIKQGRIFKEFRSFFINLNPIFNELFNCAMCLGFWCGMFIALLISYNILNIFLFSCAISFLSFITQQLITVLCSIFENHTLKNKEK